MCVSENTNRPSVWCMIYMKVASLLLCRTCPRCCLCIPKVYDPSCTGFVDAEVLRNVFDNLGFGRISDEDLLMLVEAADSDGDGRVSIEDFRGISDFSGKEERAPSDDNTKNNGIIQAQN